MRSGIAKFLSPIEISQPSPHEDGFSRRDFLFGMSALAASALYIKPALAETVWDQPRRLVLHRKATGEVVDAVYWYGQGMVQDGYVQLCHLLRDVQANQVVQMNMVLLDILYGIQQWFALAGQNRIIDITSAYRSRWTNFITEGAARDSRHLTAEAADLKIPGVPVEYLGKLALYLQGGGVGFYQKSGHVHVDRGRIRVWHR